MSVRRSAVDFGGVQVRVTVAVVGEQGRLLVRCRCLQVRRDRFVVSRSSIPVRPFGSLPRLVGVAAGDPHVVRGDRHPGRQLGPPQLQLRGS